MMEHLKTILRPVKRRLFPKPAEVHLGRELIASHYLCGEGIEIGALHNPLKVPPSIKVRYVDRMSVADLRKHYPELAALPLVPVDIVDNGEHLKSLGTNTQDFIIANHFLEHSQDPIRTLKNFLRVLKPGGVIYLAVPDKRYTFDFARPVTTMAHLYQDHEQGPEGSRHTHFEEWTHYINGLEGEAATQDTQRLEETDYSIHFHVWTNSAFTEFLSELQDKLGFDIELIMQHGMEVITILRKYGGDQEQQREQSARGSLHYARTGGKQDE